MVTPRDGVPLLNSFQLISLYEHSDGGLKALFWTLLSLILPLLGFSQVLGTLYDLLLNGAHLDMINEIMVFQGQI